MEHESIIDALTAEAEKYEAKAVDLRRAIAILEGVDPDEVDEEDEEGDRAPLSTPSRATARDNRGGGTCELAGIDGEGRCSGDVLTTKPCKYCGELSSRCEGHGGRRSAAQAHRHACEG